jgi:hypothetical protein
MIFANVLTNGPAPYELTLLRLCRDVYHCTPSQLRRESFVDILRDLEVMDIEAKAEKMRPKK